MVDLNHVCFYLGRELRQKIERYASEHDISRSAVVKLAVHKFLKSEGGT